jgi:hypothetical protein
LGPAVYLAFVVFVVAVGVVRPVEFRSPARYGILVPYLLLFVRRDPANGPALFRIDRKLWLVTVATTVLLLGLMGIAGRMGIGWIVHQRPSFRDSAETTGACEMGLLRRAAFSIVIGASWLTERYGQAPAPTPHHKRELTIFCACGIILLVG